MASERRGDVGQPRATQHYATGDYYPEFRRMHRITVGGDRPVGVRAT